MHRYLRPPLLAAACSLVVAACGGARTADDPGATPEPQPNDMSSSEVPTPETAPDPFRWLELDSPETQAWIDAQNAATEAWMAARQDPTRRERLGELLRIGSYGGVARAGGLTFVEKREGDAEQAVLFVMPDGAEEPRVLLDPNALGERVALDWFYPSPRGTYLAYGLSRNGDERSTLRVLEVATGEDTGVEIPHTKWVALDWLPDESGFFYTRYPWAEAVGGTPESGDPAVAPDTYDRHLYRHLLGTDPARDPLVMRAPTPTDFLSGEVSEDGRWLLIGNFRGWSASDMYLLALDEPDAAPQPLVVGEDAIWMGTFHRGYLYVQTNADAPLGRILRVPIASASDRSAWIEVVPEGEGKLEGFAPVGDWLVTGSVENVSSVLRTYALDGSMPRTIDLPQPVGSAGSLAADPDEDRFVYAFDSFFHPPSLYAVDLQTGWSVLLDQVEAEVDTSAFTVSRVSVASEDGTPINVFYAHRADMPLDGAQPVLLTGYGGFDVSLTPGFARNAIYWLERGGVYAVANIRGGGEFGETWHQAGMLGNKQNVFDDFEAVIRWFGGDSGISSPDRIAITGGSNGGLLMGAMLTQCPDAFAAAVSSVGLYDMARYHLFPPAEIWIPEYGDPDEPEHMAWLLAYSPYHNVRPGVSYPATLILTADSDTRVSWQHSTKFAAALQHAHSGARPILFWMQRGQGHGAGTGLSDLVDEYVERYTFIESELDVR